jgi:hypothetical protein
MARHRHLSPVIGKARLANERADCGIQMVWEPYGYHKRYQGLITGTDIAASVIRQVSDPRFVSAKYAINEYAPGTRIQCSEEESRELERIERQYGYKDRRIVLAYVTQDLNLIEFLGGIFLESPILIYDTEHAARTGISKILESGLQLDTDGPLNPSKFLSARPKAAGRSPMH